MAQRAFTATGGARLRPKSNTAVVEVNSISAKNREGIDTLVKEVLRFKVD